MSSAALIDVSPFRLSGVAYGTLLNHCSTLEALGDTVHRTPYIDPPKAPILYVKPRNTFVAPYHPVVVPREARELEVGACLGIVIGRPACRVVESDALDHVAGFVIVNDISIPHDSFYRPAVSLNARDSFCPIGSFVRRELVADPDQLSIRVFVDGDLKLQASTRDVVRRCARLLADVTDFMTLNPGDVLATGAPWPAPRVRAGQVSRIEIGEIGALQTSFVAAGT